MPRGGARTPKEGKKIGRPKVERLSDPNVSAKILHDVKHELLLKALVAIEVHRLGIDLKKTDFGASEAPRNVSIIPFLNLLDRLQCHAHGNPRTTVNHLHDKPLDVNVTHSVSERLRLAMEKAEKRLADAK